MRNSQLVEALKLNADILNTFIRSIPDQAIMERRKNFWTIHEHLEHLAEMQPILYQRIVNVINEEEPVITPYYPEDNPESGERRKTVEELLEAFSSWRSKQVALIETCDESIWDKTAEHPEYDTYTFEILVRHVLMHDGFHMYRIEELWLVKDEFIKPLP